MRLKENKIHLLVDHKRPKSKLQTRILAFCGFFVDIRFLLVLLKH